MKKIAMKLALAFCALGSLASAQAGEADFTLVNSTGYPLREVYISSSSKNNWGSDKLGSNVLADGASRLFQFSSASDCEKDLRVVFDDDGSAVVWGGIDLCTLNTITLKYNRSSGVTTAVKD